MHDNNKSFVHTKSNLQSKAVSLSKYSWTFNINRPYLNENLNTVYCIVFCILMDCKHSLMYFNVL